MTARVIASRPCPRYGRHVRRPDRRDLRRPLSRVVGRGHRGRGLVPEALAEEGPALELGIGTGRVAIPLTEAGVDVHGVETSDAMVSKLRAKPGGDGIDITIGFADFSLETRFPLVYVVFNTFFSLLTQDEQVSSFEAVARHLTAGGAFVMQAFVPDVTRFEGQHQRVAVESVGIDEITLEMSSHDAVAQRTDSQYVLLRQGRSALPGSDPLRVRLGARSDGPSGRPEAPRAMGHLEARTVPLSELVHISVWELVDQP